jgi:hypothetical protein
MMSGDQDELARIVRRVVIMQVLLEQGGDFGRPIGRLTSI